MLVKILSTDLQSWPYSPENVHLVWNLSQLQEMEVSWHLLGFISKSNLPRDFRRLRRLKTEHKWIGTDSPAEYGRYHTVRTAFLNSILDQAPEGQFLELDVRCHLPIFSLLTLTRHGRSLRILKLLDASGFEVDGSVTPTTTVEDLTILQSKCPNLTELVIGINIGCREVSCIHVHCCPCLADHQQAIAAFVALLSVFRNLRTLTMYMQKLPNWYVSLGNDRVLEFSQYFAEQVSKHKAGLPLSTVSINIGEFTMLNLPHRRIDFSKVKVDLSEVYQPRRLLSFSWDSEGQMSIEEAAGRGR